MKIVHFCFSTFVDGTLYQENELVREHIRTGLDVLVVASTETYDSKGRITYAQPKEYIGSEGAKVIRLPYPSWLPRFLGAKIRYFPNVEEVLNDFRPDVIMFHGSSAWALLNVAKYVDKNPSVEFYIDSHADQINSARGFLSREILHRRFYAPILRVALKASGPLLCVSQSTIDFAREVYSVPNDRIEFYPLGGRVLNPARYEKLRKSMRERLGADDSKVVLVQAGRMNRQKKLARSLRAFSKVKNHEHVFVIAGVLQDEVSEECQSLIDADPRVSFIGWMGTDDMVALLSAADVYLQPGTQSATMQMALCCGCAVILDAIPSHEFYTDGTGWAVKSEVELQQALCQLTHENVARASSRAMKFAAERLDYRILAERLVSGRKETATEKIDHSY